MRNRRGSFTVFVLMLFSAFLVAAWAVITVSGKEAVSAAAHHFGRLWGSSILAEYDLALKERYGIYGFYGEDSIICSKLDQYASYTMNGKPYARYEGSTCSLTPYCLADPDVIKEQMEEAVLYGNRPHLFSNLNGQAPESSTFGSRTITSRWILENLPSYGNGEEADAISAAEAAKKGTGIRELVGSAAVNQYIFTYFRHYCGPETMNDTYFRNEIEYILCGKSDDEKALKKTKQKLVLFRNALNLAYLYSCPEKREAAMALASVMTPGPEAVLTQGLLLEIWAYAEAENDVAILYDGKQVPLLKGDRNWALTLENAAGTENSSLSEQEETPKKYIRPDIYEGLDYESYLKILLNVLPVNTRILRAMDLIQVNLKYRYCGSFRLEDYYTGLEFSLKISGVQYDFKETYTGQLQEREAEE